MRWIARGLLGLLVLLVLAAVSLWLYAERTLPQTDGTMTLHGARAELRIERDGHGIPTIHAASANDAFFGLGVVHAQDRLWQLETHRRIGAGRLAEAFGPGALETDRFLRALGVRRAAQAQWAQTSGASREALLAYAAGIDAVLKDQLRARPPEFLILGVQPEPWDPVDSLAWAIMMAWDLGANWATELHRLRLSASLPVERIDQFLPPYPGEAPLPVRDYAALYRELGLTKPAVQQSLNRLLDIAPPSGIEGVGSNNWVVAGSHTTTGKPLLANDPHLKLSAPALWYFARLKAPGLDVAGATMPGLPIVVLGQNARVAWGFTNTGPDVQDLYIEEIVDGAPERYRTPDGHAAFEVAEEVIRVKGQPDVPITVRRTRHGPVISDAGVVDDVIGKRHVLAMRWTALDADTDPVGVGLGFMRAGSVAEFFAAAEPWVAPMQNMVVADVDGAIGVISPGRVPLRGPDNDLRGLAPAPGWDARYDWIGWVPAGQTPREINPARGWIATANQRIHAPDYPHFITSEWALPYRQQRIEQLLGERPKHSLQDLRHIQSDVKSLAAAPLLKAEPAHPLLAAAREQLAGFDGTMAADRAAPLIYWAWMRQLSRAVLLDEASEALFEKAFATRSFQDALEGVLARNDAWWCDDKRTPAAETCEQAGARALGAALDELSARFGAKPAAWRWGDAHQARSEHRPFSRVKPLARFFELRTPVGGDTYTVNVSRVGLRPDPTTGELYLDEHGPSLRGLYDLGYRSRSQVMHSTGQSGILFSPLYNSFVERWAQVGTVPLWPAERDAASGGRLLIRPATSSQK
mgnify:CR=1 FL=1